MAKLESFATLIWGLWLEFMGTNEIHVLDPFLLWAMAKVVLRGCIMANVASYKKPASVSLVKTSSLLREAYTKFKDQPTVGHKTTWMLAKKDFEIWVEKKEQLHRSLFEADLFQFGNKAGKLLAHLAKGRLPTSHITALCRPDGKIENNPKKIYSMYNSIMNLCSSNY